MSDDELLLSVEMLGDDALRRAALAELLIRLRAEADADGLDYAETFVARLAATLAHEDEEDGPDAAGVREPRRPAPEDDSVADSVEVDRRRDAA